MLSLFLAAAVATANLPLVEVPTTKGTSDTLVVFVSGDGGWAKIDKEMSKVLADNGMPVVGLNALQYFWTKRTPDAAASGILRLSPQPPFMPTSARTRDCWSWCAPEFPRF